MPTDVKERVLLPDAVLPQKYDIRLQPDLEKFVFGGSVRISVDVHEATDEVSVHARELQFISAKFVSDSSATPIEVAQFQFNKKMMVMKLCFDELLPVGAGVIEIEYTGILNNEMAGFYRSSYTDIKGVTKTMACTQFESIDARRCFPCWDEPARKAIHAITLVVDPSLTAFSNMPEKSSQLIKVGSKYLREIVFMDSPKMSTYLAAVVVGEFDFVQTLSEHGVLVRVYTPPGRSAAGMFALDKAKRCLDLFDDFFGLPYPLPKMDLVAIPDFAAGAMENWGLVTYREVALLIDEKTASNVQKQRVCTVVAHELAHQWFGNLVTMAWWDDLWLNEGFASWCQNYISDLVMPDYELWNQFLTETLSSAMRLDGLKTSHPIQVPIKHAEEVEEVFDHISYFKGASVIRLAHEVLGHEAFKTGLQNYMKKHQYGNTETSDLWAAWSEASGLPVDKIMASWTEQMGYPMVEVTAFKIEGTVAKLTLAQSWFLSSGESPPDGRTWSLPVFAASGAEKGKMVMMKDKTLELEVPVLGASDYVLLNPGMLVPMRVSYSPEMRSQLVKALQNGALTSCKDRAMLVLDAFALAKAGRMGLDDVFRVISALSGESHYVVLVAICQVLSETSRIFMGGASQQVHVAYKKFAEKYIQKVWKVTDPGFETKASDGHLSGLVRGLMMKMVAKYAPGADFLAEAKQRFAKYMEDPVGNASVLPDEYRVPVFQAILENGGSKEHADLMATIPKLKSNVEQKHVYLSIGSSSSRELKEAALKWAISGEVKLQDFFYVFMSVSESSKEGLELTSEFYQREFATIRSMTQNATAAMMDHAIKASFAGYCTEEKASAMEKFFEQNPLPLNKRTISQVLEDTRNSAQFLAKAMATDAAKEQFWAELTAAIPA
mmetsp:Transcript_26571/g.62089  ORF Transcript_26571/g.62089 Transcript_26571/m.62089 type:complete len:891 (+) Transcript_26571:103-2775(+)